MAAFHATSLLTDHPNRRGTAAGPARAGGPLARDAKIALAGLVPGSQGFQDSVTAVKMV
jgi:hypothetical protein